ncbi:hypothetical protein RvY_08231 [Ramazzottius varieornatus]|uniref:Uncharacterized protein n=1 Tax=Ramazzottius varieornatus TaxID=947166 RepID=A0A1D1V549_RAMVA|nr:hypothetical protein RvY_08231 [Ramazzottius varieornatus]
MADTGDVNVSKESGHGLVGAKWCCIEACRGGGFLKNKIVQQVDAYMPGVRVNDDTGKTEYYEPTDEEIKALGSVLNVIKDMATMK